MDVLTSEKIVTRFARPNSGRARSFRAPSIFIRALTPADCYNLISFRPQSVNLKFFRGQLSVCRDWPPVVRAVVA